METKKIHIKVGDIIRVTRKEVVREHVFEDITNHYRVVQKFPRHVLCVDINTGIRRSFCIGDLVVMGYERRKE